MHTLGGLGGSGFGHTLPRWRSFSRPKDFLFIRNRWEKAVLLGELRSDPISRRLVINFYNNVSVIIRRVVNYTSQKINIDEKDSQWQAYREVSVKVKDIIYRQGRDGTKLNSICRRIFWNVSHQIAGPRNSDPANALKKLIGLSNEKKTPPRSDQRKLNSEKRALKTPARKKTDDFKNLGWECFPAWVRDLDSAEVPRPLRKAAQLLRPFPWLISVQKSADYLVDGDGRELKT